ncbi:MAG: dihydroorotate dehydrogenase electron transfer subunit [Nitrospirota bacterium]
MIRYFKARISENRQLNGEHNLLTLVPLTGINEPEPGQFYMTGTGACNYDPLLKRPFSLFRRKNNSLQILYRIKGRGTSLISGLGEGAIVDMLGPLGNSYPMPAHNETPLIIAGGIGIAPLFSLAERLAGRAYIFYGARTRDELFFLAELKVFAKGLFISTDDGSYGEKGAIIAVLNDFLTRHSSPVTRHLIYACGPAPMFESLWNVVRGTGIKTYVTLEENMACGIGACLGCVVNTGDGHKSVCKEGPVFLINDILHITG